MSSAIYKSGQGYWVRLMSAIAYGVVIVLGLNWLWGWLETMSFGDIETVYVQVAAILLFAMVFGLIGYSIIGRRQRTVDFFIATEGEMKKVNWSTRREVVGSTVIVLVISFLQEELKKSGLVLNFAPGKIEAVVAWRGPDSRAFTRELEVIDGAQVITLTTGEKLRVVRHYKHVGTWSNASATLNKEVSARVQSHEAAYLGLAGPILA